VNVGCDARQSGAQSSGSLIYSTLDKDFTWRVSKPSN